MRTVRDARGISWICLEMPVIPADYRAAAAASPTEVVAIECNSGAERVIVLLAPGWDDHMTDNELTETITSAMR